MNAKDLVVDHHAQCEEVEHVSEVVPYIGVPIFPRTLGVEAVRLCHAAGLVVASNKMDPLWVAELEADEERDGLYTEQTSINVVSCMSC